MKIKNILLLIAGMVISAQAFALNPYYGIGYNWTTYYSNSVAVLAEGQSSWTCERRPSSVETLTYTDETHWSFTCVDLSGGQGFATTYYCAEGLSYNDEEQTCEVYTPPPDTNPQCKDGSEYSSNYGICVPECGSGSYYDIGAKSCLNEQDCPDQVSDRDASLTVNFSWEVKCANGCQAEWHEKEGVSTLRSGQGTYLYNGLNCSATSSGGGSECVDEEGNVIACGNNPDNDDPETGTDPGEEPKPDPNEGGDPHGDDHETSEPLTPDDPKCDGIPEVYWDSSDPLQIEPSQIYFDCDKVHDSAEPNPDDEPAECAELDIWEWSSTNPYSTPPPPEYADCPSRVDDTSPVKEEEDSLCRDEDQLCDTQFPKGADGICDLPPICIEEDGFQCVTLRIQWEQACQYAIEKGSEALAGLESKLGQSDLDFLKPGGAGILADIDVLATLDNSGWGLSRSCPAPPSFSAMGKTFTLNNSSFCSVLEIIGNLMLVFTALGAARMIVS